MKNKIALLVAAVLLVPTLAAAGDRYNRGYNGHNRGYNYNHNHGYKHNYNRNNNWVAPAIGAVILGGVIGAAIANQPRYIEQAPVYVVPEPSYVVPQPSYRYENVYVPSCACYQTVLVQN